MVEWVHAWNDTNPFQFNYGLEIEGFIHRHTMDDNFDDSGEGAEAPQSEQETRRHSRGESSSSRRVPGQPMHHQTIIRYETQRPIYVEAENFKDVVQRLTGKSWNQNDLVQDRPSAEQPLQTSSGSSRVSHDAWEGSVGPQQSSPVTEYSNQVLENFLSRLDSETRPQDESSNLGFFPTAGLVKGVDLELGLQWARGSHSVMDSSRPSGSSSSPDRGLK